MAKLLIVDDEEKIREMIGKYAVHEGYETVLACDGKQAVELFKKDDFDLVVLDVMMPEMDGYEALKRIKQIKDVPCILTERTDDANQSYPEKRDETVEPDRHRRPCC